MNKCSALAEVKKEMINDVKAMLGLEIFERSHQPKGVRKAQEPEAENWAAAER